MALSSTMRGFYLRRLEFVVGGLVCFGLVFDSYETVKVIVLLGSFTYFIVITCGI